ncbi:hypothetical protein RhiirB3_434782 [Rhizophagus irregularis]|nr:hypothetical protein RhiirB3_434782 [Rhizophagus irregularis]
MPTQVSDFSSQEALSSFALLQFTNYWMTDLEFQAVIHDIPKEMTMATLWSNCKPCEFLMQCGASSLKEKTGGNWKTTLKALDQVPVTLPTTQFKPNAKNALNNEKSGSTGQVLDSNKSKKDKKHFSTKASKNDNQLKSLVTQKKAKYFSKSKGGGNNTNKPLALDGGLPS